MPNPRRLLSRALLSVSVALVSATTLAEAVIIEKRPATRAPTLPNGANAKEATLDTEFACYRVADASLLDCAFTHRAIKAVNEQPGDDAGHAHDLSTRPAGELEFNGRTLAAKDGLQDGQTQHQEVTVKHKMPQAAGKILMQSTVTLPEGFFCAHDCDTVNSWRLEQVVSVKIPEPLIALPAAPGLYVRCAKTAGCTSDSPGGDPNHPNPFFGRPALVNLLIGLAAMYRSQYPAADGARLRITDMNLERGGLFDLGANWAVPHKSHRRGTSADISRIALRDGGGTSFVNQKTFNEIARLLGLSRLTETTSDECPVLQPGEPPCIHLEL